jgi:hypothetical protein
MGVSVAKNMWRGTGTPLKVLVEYGMLGLRVAAAPPRPSKTKKGAMVGFDPSKGHRFSTYARPYAKKEMTAAVGGYVSPALKPEFEHKTTATVEDWMTKQRLVRLPTELTPRAHPILTFPDGWRCPPVIVPYLRDPGLKYHIEIFLFLISRRRLPAKCPSFGTIWHPPESIFLDIEPARLKQIVEVRTQYGFALPALEPPDEPRKRNFLKHPRTETELADKGLYYLGVTLKTYKKAAEDGLEGWGDADDSAAGADFILAQFERTHALDPKVYRLPKHVLLHRWKLGKVRYEKAPYSSNQGLGLYDKRGRKLPVYPSPDGGVIIRRKGKKTPFLYFSPLASIYLMREAWKAYMMVMAAGLDFTPTEKDDERTHQDAANQFTDCPEPA